MIKDLKEHSPNVLRIGISLVFLWFGFQQILHSSDWVSYLPLFVTNLSISATTFVLLNGIFEVLFGLLLITGLYTREVSGLLALHMIGIMFSVGYNEIGIRDFGIFIALLAIFLHGRDEWCLDNKLRNGK